MSEPTKDRRLPLATLVFNQPTSVPGTATMLTALEAHEQRRLAGIVWECPALFIDYGTRTVHVGDREYPFERVHYWSRATTAFAPRKLPKHDYREGKH